MVVYSHSRLSVFEQCPLKYKFKYIDLIEPEIKQTIEGFLGNKVHETLEWLYKKVSENSVPDLDSVINFYIKKWNEDYSNDIKINGNNKEYYFNEGIRFLINYYSSNFPFKDNTVAIEKKVIVPLDSEGSYLIKGYIDRLVHNKEDNIFEIHDYKTGFFLKTQEELDKDRQLALYSIGIKNIFPEAKEILLIWHFLAHNKKMVSKRTEKELEELKVNVINLIRKIESTENFYANISYLCEWCEFKNHCYRFRNNSLNL